MIKIIDNIKKVLGLKQYNLARQDCLENFVGKLGKIVEEDDKIIIYATQKLVDKNCKEGILIIEQGKISFANKTFLSALEKPFHFEILLLIKSCSISNNCSLFISFFNAFSSGTLSAL